MVNLIDYIKILNNLIYFDLCLNNNLLKNFIFFIFLFFYSSYFLKITDKICNVERDAVWVKCRVNSGSECQPEEISYDGKCYKLFIPILDKENKNIQDIGFSKGEALEHCLKRGGKLLDINSQVKLFLK